MPVVTPTPYAGTETEGWSGESPEYTYTPEMAAGRRPDPTRMQGAGDIAAIGKGGPGVTDAPAASSGLNLAGVNAYSGVSDADVYSAADYFNRPQVDTNYDTFTRGQ